MGATKIEWAEKVWNPVTGCTPVSAGCERCYAKRMANRLRGRCGYPADDPFRVTVHPEKLGEPMRWRKPRRVFVCSMGDLFHEDVTDATIATVWAVMQVRTQHTFCVLTKRPGRMRDLVGTLPPLMEKFAPNSLKQAAECTFGPWPLPNVCLGVSAEDQATADARIPILLQTPAAVRFVSVEPMLGPVDLIGYFPHCLENHPFPSLCREPDHERTGLNWVICGGETGSGARPMDPDWSRSLRDQCAAAGVPFFFKGRGWAGYGKRARAGWLYRRIDDRTWDEFPQTPALTA